MQVGECRKKCTGCIFGGPKVGWKGNPESNFVIVGESPGREELRAKEPFVGSSGKLLFRFIDIDAYITNAMECYPPPQSKKLQGRVDHAAQLCHNGLIEQIQGYPRRLVVALGNPAVRSLTGNYGLKITQIRGKLIPAPELSELGILPIIHPAALLRGTGSYRQFREDLLYAKHLALGGEPRNYEEPVWFNVTAENFDSVCKHIKEFEYLAADIETTSLSHCTGNIINMGLQPIGATWHTEEGQLKKLVYIFEPEFLPLIQDIFEGSQKWIWHNGKFDVKFIRELGIHARVHEDTMLLSYALDENPGVHDLETVGADVLGAPDYKNVLKPYLPNKAASYSLVPRPILDKYLASDVNITAGTFTILRKRVAEDPVLEKLYTKTLLPASEMLAEVEAAGIYVLQDRLEQNSREYQVELKELRDKLCAQCGTIVNPNSPQQVANVLYNKFKLPKRGGGGTGADILEKLPQIPFVKTLLEYRTAAKAFGTYVGIPRDPKTKKPKGLYKYLGPDGRAHATYLIHGTLTGRLSCRNPNLQNQPRLIRLRGQFGAPEGRGIVEGDLSQAELRSLACLSGDPDLLDIYLRGLDLHTELARFLFPGWDERYAAGEAGNAAMKAQAKEERVLSKTVNFGIVYGRTAFTIAAAFDISVTEAQRLIDGWFLRFPVAKRFIDKCRATASNGNIMTTTFGRKKRPGIISSANMRDLQNQAANFPHSSIASDITLHSAITIWPKLQEYDSFIVNLVHDSIMIETPDDEEVQREVASLLVRTMESTAPQWGLTKLPFIADAGRGNSSSEFGPRWGYLKDFERNELRLAA